MYSISLSLLNVLSTFYYNLKSLEWDKGQTLVLEKTHENLIESSLQSRLSYIPIQMVHASYCVPYSKWPCIRHEANMWCIYCITSLFPEPFTFFFSSPMINVVTTLSVTNHSNPNLRVLKIENCKIIKN